MPAPPATDIAPTPILPLDTPVVSANASLYTPVTTTGDPMIMEWGTLQFRVWPLNFNEYDHSTETDWAKKEIAGAAIYREWVGENDETIFIRGKIFPYRIGGMSELESFESQRRQGMANMLMRGDGVVLGWYVVEKLTRNHTFLSSQGVGRQVAFDAIFVRVPVPDPRNYLAQLWVAGGLPTGP